MSNSHLSETAFSSLDIDQKLKQAVDDAGFSYCTPIQAETLPLALAGRDVLGQAQTGTGKTAAFLLAVFQRLLDHPLEDPAAKTRQPRAFIVAPTRELALQIERDARILGKYCKLRILVVYGGTGYESQRQALSEGVDILIATPGRAIDYFKQKIYNLQSVQALVLDEADRMFDLGFIKDIRFLLRRLPSPEKRLSMLFSATLPLRVSELAYEHMNSPTTISIKAKRITSDKVKETLYSPGNEEKIPLLIGLLNNMDAIRTIIFVNTKRSAEIVGACLEGNDFNAAILSGDVPQKKRTALFNKFKEGNLPILIATDVASRGLHIPNVSHVINYDLPQDAEDYVHRIGRTARVGESGEAISFACENYAFSLPDLQDFLGYELPRAPITPELLATPKPSAKRIRRNPPAKHRQGTKPQHKRPQQPPKK